MGKKTRTIVKALTADDVKEQFELFREQLAGLPHGIAKPKDETSKLIKLATRKPVDFVLSFDAGAGRLDFEAVVGSTRVPLGTAEVEKLIGQQKRMDVLQSLKRMGLATESDIAAIERRALRPERRIYDAAVRLRDSRREELAAAARALEVAQKEVDAAAKKLPKD